MDVGQVATKDFVVESVLEYLDTEELFTCAEVSRLWQSIALSLLRKKLISVSVCCVTCLCSFADRTYDLRETNTRAAAQEAEQSLPESALGSGHMCVDIFCSKFSRFRNIARLARMRPSLIFLSYHANLTEDKRVAECLRGLLPPDSVIIYFKLELVRAADESDDSTHEGIFGEFLFHADGILPAPATYDEPSDEKPPDSSVPCPSSSIQGHELQPHTGEEPPAQALPTPATDEEPSPETTPPASPPLTWPRPLLPSGGYNNGAVFHNVLPGVLMFQALHVTEASLEGAPTHPPQSSTGPSLPMADCLQALASQGEADRRALMQDFETRFATRLLSLETALAQRTSTADDVVADLAARVSVIEAQSNRQQRVSTSVEQNNIGRAQSRFFGAHLPPPTFDGTTSWAAFLVQFESVATLNGWTVQDKAQLLVLQLRDAAAEYLEYIPQGIRSNYEALVTSAAIFNAMPSSRLVAFMRNLSENFGSTTNTIAVAFPKNQEEARQELEAFERVFPGVPALANQATEFNVDGQYAPHGRLKLILLLIKLLD
ncbi:hypothetical protein HPB52_006936 [Rhipicephalus sanguineus]|uniref:F-box domain-containing protein n=1 Tax=Rhipicephalus sanguineus TaxID=34632 RepID=A0A9D4QLK6_RHISA|nr:hypothetical protein HPB52_006936 [Rhipicephalus sanguineus]